VRSVWVVCVQVISDKKNTQYVVVYGTCCQMFLEIALFFLATLVFKKIFLELVKFRPLRL
jgi:hypothetical protein